MAKGRLTAAFLKAVGKYMLVETKLGMADVCIVFGNPHADHLAAHAAKLYHQGYFKTIVVSGKPATDDGRPEATRLRDVLVQQGVPASAILVEDKATNSGENVLYTMQLLKDKGLLNGINSIIAVGHIHAARRFLMTLEKHWPQPLKMFTTNNCFGVPANDWHKDAQFRAMVLSEYDKIPDYKAKGFITEVDIDAINRRAANLNQPPRKPPSPGF